MSKTVELCDKINRLFNQRDNEQHIKTDDILEVSSLIVGVEPSSIIPDLIKSQLLIIIKDKLASPDRELQKSTLTLLCQCFDLHLFTEELPLSDLSDIIVDKALIKDIDVLEEQELWLKALDALLKLPESALTPVLTKRDGDLLSTINLALSSHVMSSPKKLKALKLLDSIIWTSNLNESMIKSILEIFYEILIPTMFDATNKHLQVTIDTANHIIQKVPFKDQVADARFPKYVKNDIATNYIPVIAKFVEDGNVVFSQLWNFILKHLKLELHKNWALVNILLNVVEKAFKSMNMDVRKHAYHCWQELIDNFALSLNELKSPKRLKLMMTPLKTTNCKREDIIRVKYETWCKLINVLSDPVLINSMLETNVLDIFLNFCFGPLGETPLISYIHCNSMLASPGKKVMSLHLEMCENFLKIIGSKSVMKHLPPKHNIILKFDGPLVTSGIFMKSSRVIVYSAGEASVLLSACSNVEHATIINQLIWEAVFELIESAIETDKITSIIDVISAIILNIIVLSRKRPKLSQFCVKHFFKLVKSEKYAFCKLSYMDKKIYRQLVSTVFRKDNCSSSDLVEIFNYVFAYKRYDPGFISFIENALDEMVSVINDNSVAEKVNSVFDLWNMMGNEIKLMLQKNHKDDEVMSVFRKYLMWPVMFIHLVMEQKTILDNWTAILTCYKTVSHPMINKVARQLIELIIEKHENANKPISLNTEAIFIHLIINILDFEKNDAGDYADLIEILNKYSQLVAKPDLPEKCVEDLVKSLEHIFSHCFSDEEVLLQVLPTLTDSFGIFVSKYQKIDILNSLKEFMNKIQLSENLRPLIIKLINPLKNSKTLTAVDVFDNMYNLLMKTHGELVPTICDFSEKEEIEIRPQAQKTDEEVKDENDENMKVLNNNDTPGKKKKSAKPSKQTVVTGVDIDTMKPVKMKGSILSHMSEQDEKSTPLSTPAKNKKSAPNSPKDEEFVHIDSPYKFDVKKLTKSQKAKLGRRRDDIPALYQDLSQSQSQNFFSDSSSNLVADEKIANNVIDKHQAEEKEERAFGEISNEISNENEKPVDDQKDESEKEQTPVVASVKRPKRKGLTEISKIKMHNIVGFESHLNSIDTSDSVIRTRNKGQKKKEEISGETPVRRKRGRPRKLDSPNNDRKENSRVEESPLYPEDVQNKSDCKAGSKSSSPLKVKEDSGANKSIPVSSSASKRLSLDLELTTKRVKKDDNVKEKNGSSECTEEKKNTVPKIILLRSPVEKGSNPVFKLLNTESEPPENKEKKDESDTSKTSTEDKDTQSVSSQMFISEDIPDKNYPNTSKLICRKVLFDNEEETDTQTPVDEPLSTSPQGNIVSSPVRKDTPTRNKELLKNTLEISPIKTCNGSAAASSTFGEMEIVNTNSSTSIILKSDTTEKSPELFNSESSDSKEIVDPQLPAPATPKSLTRKSKLFLQGRGAQMMNLLTPNKINKTEQALVPSPTKNTKLEPKTKFLYKRGASRISKMMVQLDIKTTSDSSSDTTKTPVKNIKINEEDIFHFSKALPSPLASPSCSILRKRKRSDDNDEALSPCSKKKKVNFSDPIVSSRKFIEGRARRYNIRPKLLDVTADDLLMTDDMDDEEELAHMEIVDDEINGDKSSDSGSNNYNKNKVTELSGDNVELIIIPKTNSINEAESAETSKVDKIEDKVCDFYKKDKVKEVCTSGETEIITPTPSVDIKLGNENPPDIEITKQSDITVNMKTENGTDDNNSDNSNNSVQPSSIKDKETNVSKVSQHNISNQILSGKMAGISSDLQTLLNKAQEASTSKIIEGNNIRTQFNLGTQPKKHKNELNASLKIDTPTTQSVSTDELNITEITNSQKISVELLESLTKNTPKQNAVSLNNMNEAMEIETSTTPAVSVDKMNISDATTSPKVISDSEKSPVEIRSNLQIAKKCKDCTSNVDNWKIIADKDGIYKKLTECSDPIYSNINKLKLSNSDEFLSVLMSKNIKNIGDLVKIPGEELHSISVNSDLIKTILDQHNCEDHMPKQIRKIRPITISSPSKRQKVISAEKCSTDANDIKGNKDRLLSDNLKNAAISEAASTSLENRLCSSPAFSSPSSSPSPPGTPLAQTSSYHPWSPICSRDNILDTEVKFSGRTLKEVLVEIKNIFIEKNCEPRQILQEYIGPDMFTNSSPTSGPLRIHHLAIHQKWDDIFSDIVACIGVKKLVKHVTRLKTVPQDMFFEHLYKYITKDTNMYNIRNVLSFFDATCVFQALGEILHDQEFRVAFQENFVPSIIQNIDVSKCVIEKLSTVQLGDEIIQRISNDSQEKDMFLQKLQEKANKDKIVAKKVSGDDTELTKSLMNILKHVENDSVLSDVHTDMLEKIFNKLTYKFTLDFFTKVLDRKYENK